MNTSITDDYLDTNIDSCEMNHARVSWDTPRVDPSGLSGGGETTRSIVDRDAASDGLENSSDHHNLSVEIAVNIAKQETLLSRKKRFRRGDNVLVALKLMDLSVDGLVMVEEASSSRKRLTTTNPVNKYGFPPGEGITEEHKKGPYEYVLATVKSIHFGEDAIYYVVERFDNKHCQRAERGKSSNVSPCREEIVYLLSHFET
jgi:hypothetical protein